MRLTDHRKSKKKSAKLLRKKYATQKKKNIEKNS